MKLLKITTAAMGLAVTAHAAQAADLLLLPEPIANQDAGLVAPAVSGVNGKLELDLGYLTDPDSAVFRGAGALTLPVGDAFGLQGDLTVQSIDGNWSLGGALHAFTRDPVSHLIGVTASALRNDNATLTAIGPEAELYLGAVSLEGWAGWATLDHDYATPDRDGLFAIGDVAWYANDDWRLSVGAASILGVESLRAATEYQFAPDLGLALNAEARWYETDALQATIGLTGYFGEPGKSLIDRHRQDDPRVRILGAGDGGELMNQSTAPSKGEPDDEGPSDVNPPDDGPQDDNFPGPDGPPQDYDTGAGTGEGDDDCGIDPEFPNCLPQ